MIEESSQLNATELLASAKRTGEYVALRLAQELISGGVVDVNLADQLIIFMALAVSKRISSLRQRKATTFTNCESKKCELLVGNTSAHIRSAMRIAEIVLGDIEFSTKSTPSGALIITCQRREVSQEVNGI